MTAADGAMTSRPAPAAATDAVAAAAPNKRPFSRWWRELGWRHLVGIVAIVFAVFPVVWIFSASVDPSGSISGQQLWPDNATLDNYRELLDPGFGDPEINVPYTTWYANTMLIAGGAAIGQVLLSALAAYAFSRMRFRGRRSGLLVVLLVQMFPQLLAFTAIFVLISDIGGLFPAIGLGTRLALILVYLGGAMGVNTWLMKGFFDTIPKDLDEAAKVDGATPNQIFFRVVLPLGAPILAVIGLLSFIFLINDFVIAAAVVGQGGEEGFTLSIGLQRFVVDQYGERWGVFAAGSILAGLPVILLFWSLQRFIVSGLTQGGVKG